MHLELDVVKIETRELRAKLNELGRLQMQIEQIKRMKMPVAIKRYERAELSMLDALQEFRGFILPTVASGPSKK